MYERIPAVVLFGLYLSPVIGSGIPAADKPAEPDTFFSRSEDIQ